jgi:acetoin:2,6-dichlorophenolindophenol oxidoreductase subunit alpha
LALFGTTHLRRERTIGALELTIRAWLVHGCRRRRRRGRLAHPSTKGAEVPDLDGERLTWMYTQMLRIREFEERVKRTFEDHPGVIRGHTHLADGAEASIVGSLAALRDGDQLLTTYRCHGYPIALGTDPKAIMAEIYGRKDGLCGGYGGSMHLVDPDRGFLGTSGIVGQGIPHACGAAYAAQIRGEGQVVLSFFGDGASKQGAFHESLNIASLWKLPIVFVMENNNYNVYTRVEQEDANAAAGEPLAVKAKAYSMPGETVDGGDPVAVHDVVSAAVERARSGEGPTFVESLVYRLSAHGNIIAPPGVPLHFPEHEAITIFGNVEEYEAAKRGDPIPRFRARLIQDGTLSAEDADRIAEEVGAEMEAAVQFGLDSPFPAAEAATEYVYA